MINPDRIIRSARKTLSVSIDAFGKLTVRAPKRMSDEKIFAFLKEKEAWITERKRRRDGLENLLPKENLDGYTFLLLGEEHHISLSGGRKVLYDKDNKVISVPKDNAQNRITAWLKRKAKDVFSERTKLYAEKMNANVSRIGVSSAKKRWGSCLYKKAVINYTYRLIYAPIFAVDYVVVHELCHLKEHNHGKGFWTYVAENYPNYSHAVKWLKEHAYLLYIF